MSADKDKVGRKDDVISLTSKLFLESDYADITFIVEGQKLRAHRCIVAASSEYFRALLYGGFSESKQAELQVDEHAEAFKLILEYIYTGQINFTDKEESEIMDLLSLAHKFELSNLLSDGIECLCNRIRISSVCDIFQFSSTLSIKKLETEALQFIDAHAMELMKRDHFKVFSKEILSDIIIRDAFLVAELDIFNAVMAWSKDKPEEDLQFVIKNVRFTLMQVYEIHETVKPTGVLDAAEISNVIYQMRTVYTLPYRTAPLHRNQLQCVTLNDRNYWSKFYPFLQYTGTIPNKKTDGDHIIFQLRSPAILNYIYMKIFYLDLSIPCIIDVSTDKIVWHRVVTAEKSDRTGWRFSARYVKYIYIKLRENNVHNIDVRAIYDLSPGGRARDKTYGIESRAVVYENVTEINYPYTMLVNCIHFEKFSNKEVYKVESSINGKTFKNVDLEFHFSDQMLFFEPHELKVVRIYFYGTATESNDIRCYLLETDKI